ncbi:MAG: hypothetical protein AB8U25_07530 [Rickettsiales endosymbiont of Dermacentor nuttalli]
MLNNSNFLSEEFVRSFKEIVYSIQANKTEEVLNKLNQFPTKTFKLSFYYNVL